MGACISSKTASVSPFERLSSSVSVRVDGSVVCVPAPTAQDSERLEFVCNESRRSVTLSEAYAFPSWCLIHVRITEETLRLVRNSWNVVVSGEYPLYKAEIQTNVNAQLTPLVYFFDEFYSTFLSLSPDSRHLFSSGIRSQGRMLSHALKYTMANLDKPEQLDAAMRHIAVTHNRKAIPAGSYSAFGLALLSTMRKCLGDELFSPELRLAWTAVYSRMMQIMIPAVVQNVTELDEDSRRLASEYKKSRRKAKQDNAPTSEKTRDPQSASESCLFHEAENSSASAGRLRSQLPDQGSRREGGQVPTRRSLPTLTFRNVPVLRSYANSDAAVRPLGLQVNDTEFDPVTPSGRLSPVESMHSPSSSCDSDAVSTASTPRRRTAKMGSHFATDSDAPFRIQQLAKQHPHNPGEHQGIVSETLQVPGYGEEESRN